MASETRLGTARADRSGMTRAQIEALFARRQDDYDNLDAASLAADYADDAVIDSPIAGRHGKAEAEQGFQTVFKAFLDITVTTEHLIIDAGHVALVLTLEGTNIGGLFGLPPSGKSFRVPAVFLCELQDGQIIRERRIYDFTGLLVQVGVLKAKPT